jgi:hypothetical protein
VISVRRSDAASASPVPRGMTPVDVRPMRVAESRTAPDGRWYLGQPGLGRGWHVLSSRAGMMIYDRIALLDPAKARVTRHGRSYLGHMRLGIRPYSAELTVSVPMRRSTWRFALGGHLRGYLKPADMSPLWNALDAIGTSRAERDTILVNTITHRVVRLRDRLRLGTFRLGQIREVA